MGDAEIKAGRCGLARCTSPSPRLRLTCTVDGMRLGQHTTSSAKSSALGREHARGKTMETNEKMPVVGIG
jgi:hypothetical protein